jgi:hypothetical protein
MSSPQQGKNDEGGPDAEDPTRRIEPGQTSDGAMIGPYRIDGKPMPQDHRFRRGQSDGAAANSGPRTRRRMSRLQAMSDRYLMLLPHGEKHLGRSHFCCEFARFIR